MALLSLMILNSAMLVATLAAGYGSIKLSISSAHMSKVSALSTGILIGTALGVILPEGISTLYTASETLARLDSFGISFTFVVGASVLFGFIVLFTVEHVLRSRETWVPSSVSDSRQERRFWAVLSSISRSALTLGLVVHSFVDGIALGVSLVGENETVQLLFFSMVVIHKIPTAFSLTIVLLKDGIASSMCKFHILVFALATPLSSILTYFMIHLFKLNSPFALGISLLFSAGTFLYSVLHVMKEDPDSYSGQPAIASVQMSSSEPQQSSNQDIVFSIIGMLVPLFFSLTGAD